MQTYIAQATKPADAKSLNSRRSREVTVSTLPVASDSEATGEYVIGVKHELDRVHQVHLLGVTFQRFIRPTDASLAENMDDDHRYGYQALSLTDKQVKALRQAATERELFLPRAFDWRKKTWIEETWMTLSDVIYITPVSEFNPLTKPVSPAPQETQEGKTDVERVNNAIYSQQGKDKGKK